VATFAEAVEYARGRLSAGDFGQAEGVYRQLVDAAPQVPDLWHELGIVYLQTQRASEAVNCLQKAALLQPDSVPYQGNLGAAYRAAGQPQAAVECFRRALQLAPPTAELLNNLALSLKDAGQGDEALQALDQALRLRADYANGHFNRANLLVEQGRLSEAAAGFRRVLELAPRDAAAHCKLGMVHYDLGELAAALACYEQALRLQPDYPEARRNRALIWLAQGDYARGWPEYQWRLNCLDYGSHGVGLPLWDGSPLAGRRLLIYGEQGLGDTLQFVRYLPKLAEQMGASPAVSGSQVRLVAQPALAALLRQSGLGAWLCDAPQPDQFDMQCPLMNLPMLLSAGGQPWWPGPYLFAAAERATHWGGVLAEQPGLKVGLSWAGNAANPHDRFRSMHRGEWTRLLRVPGVRWISLQQGESQHQIAATGVADQVLDLGPSLDPSGQAFLDTAAVMESLDLVITVDTSIAHLAGGLGEPVWVALSRSPDWRWLEQGSTTAWYPTMRLFRQSRLGDWSAVMDAMASALALLAQGTAE